MGRAFQSEEAKVQVSFWWFHIQFYPTPAASAMPPKFDPNKIKVIYLRCTCGEIGAIRPLAPKVDPLGPSPKKVGDDIAKATDD